MFGAAVSAVFFALTKYPHRVYNTNNDLSDLFTGENLMNSDCCCRHKNTPRSDEAKKLLENRINRLTGQLNGIKKMIDEDRYCGEILIQVSAVQSALENLGYIILEDHMNTCVSEEIRKGNPEIISETLDLIRKLK